MGVAHATTPHEETRADEAGLAHRFLHYMVLMREIEDRIERKLYRQGKILGGVYVGRGQEAIPVGTALWAETQDVLFPSHRDMAVLLIRGITPRQVFAQYMGRGSGPTRGRDGNMHMGDLSLGLVSIISALAATVPVAAGTALAMRYKGIDGVCFSYFGDGATSRGDWHEGINFATVQKLPVVFVCNNNQYAYSTPLSAQMACANVADKGPAYGMPAEIVDGNDVFAVYEAAGRAVAHARAGLGPYLLECKTFRMTGHSAHDGAHYVPAGMFEEWGKLDPIVRLEQRMMENGWADRAELDAARAAILREIDEAVAWAEKEPYPDPATLTQGVYEME
jgi:pyruvate dehydrogenase E1 component alpha subunit